VQAEVQAAVQAAVQAEVQAAVQAAVQAEVTAAAMQAQARGRHVRAARDDEERYFPLEERRAPFQAEVKLVDGPPWRLRILVR